MAKNTAGERFLAAFLDEFAEPGVLYQTLLDSVVATLDLVERIEQEIEQRGLVVQGSTGQDRANPLLAELRQQRAALAKLLAELELDTGRDAAASRAGRALVAARRR